jgi:hypothetical protein
VSFFLLSSRHMLSVPLVSFLCHFDLVSFEKFFNWIFTVPMECKLIHQQIISRLRPPPPHQHHRTLSHGSNAPFPFITHLSPTYLSNHLTNIPNFPTNTHQHPHSSLYLFRLWLNNQLPLFRRRLRSLRSVKSCFKPGTPSSSC